MLSYMLPAVEDKTTSTPRNLNLNLNLNGNGIPTNGNTTTVAAAKGGDQPSTNQSSSPRLINFESTRPSALKSAIPVASSTNNSHAVAITTTNTTNSTTTTIKNTNTQTQLQPHIQSNQHTSSTTMAGNGAKSDCDARTHASNLHNHNQLHQQHHQHHQQQPPNNVDNYSILASTTTNSILTSNDGEARKAKPAKAGHTKNMGLKRVSFGSSKGSMVETLVFETPTPLPEHAEREFAFGAAAEMAKASSLLASSTSGNGPGTVSLDDSGIEMSEELERSKVRVSFYQSGKPQLISPPDPFDSDYDFDHHQHPWKHFDPLDPTSANGVEVPLLSHQHNANSSTMTAQTAVMPTYDRQMSTESGWDNPFRPGGDLSREADEIVNMIKGGKPITPTGEPGDSYTNGNAAHVNENGHSNGNTVVDGATKIESSQLQASSAQNGKSPLKNGHDVAVAAPKTTNGDSAAPAQTQISNQVVPGPQSATHVIVDDKKKKKCTCCVIQ